MIAGVFDERATLTRWAEVFTLSCGWTPTLHDLSRDELPGAKLFTLEFQPLLKPIEMLGGTGHFAHRAGHVAHLRRMGFGWNDAGRVLTSPSPLSFNALADVFAGPDTGYRLGYIREDRRCLSLGPWLRIRSRPDGYYWVAIDGRQEIGPFDSYAEALADMDSGDAGGWTPGETLAEAESELGVSDWIDPDSGAPAEGMSPTHIERE